MVNALKKINFLQKYLANYLINLLHLKQVNINSWNF